MEKRRNTISKDKYVWTYDTKIPPATAKSYYLDNKEKIDNLIQSIKWTAEDPKSDHGYYSGIDKVGNKYRRKPCGEWYTIELTDGTAAGGYSPKEALIRAME